MEDTGKRLLLAVAITMGIMLVWQYLFPPPKPTPRPPAPVAQPAGGGDAGPGQAVVPGAPGAPAAPGAAPAASCDPAGAEKLTLTTPRVEATFSACGGALSGWRMINSQYNDKLADGSKVPKDLVPRPDRAGYYPLQISMPESTAPVDPAAKWTLEKKSDTQVVASWRSDKLEVTKTYTLRPETYALELAVSVKNLSTGDLEQRLQVETYGYQNPNAAHAGMFTYAAPHNYAACYLGDEVRQDAATRVRDEATIRPGRVRWAGIDHRFFLFAAAPKDAAAEPLSCVTRGYSADPGILMAAVRYPAVRLAPGAGFEKKLVVYAGPKLFDQLGTVGTLGGGDAEFSESINLGWFAFLAKPMLWLLKFFQGFVGNWGIAIILLTITVKLLTLYWTTKGMRSMKQMAKLKPKMEELQKKYENDRARLNQEMMNLYKQQGVNPLGGCLPMLLQMPVWIALYQALNAAAELYQAPFFGHLTDLTRPDEYYILPVVVTGLMFIQQKITPTTIDSAQQRMMLIVMPLMFGAFSLFFPSGLSVYILTNSLLTMLHQMWMNKTEPAEPAKTVAAAAPVEAPPAESKPAPGGSGRKGGKGKPAKA